MPISLYEDFDSATGTFVNYDAYDTNQRAQLPGQRHLDLRTFQPTVLAPYRMSDLTGRSEASLDGSTQLQLESSRTIFQGEAWTTISGANQNFVTNPSPKYDTVGFMPVGWSTTGNFVGGASATVAAQAGVIAPRSIQVTTTAASYNQGICIAVPSGTVFTAGQTYVTSMYLKGTTGTEQLVLGAGTQGNNGGANVTLSTSWQRYSGTWLCQANVTADGTTGPTGVSVNVDTSTGVAQATTFYVDGAMLSVTPLIAYGDGDFSGWSWSGSPGRSISNTGGNPTIGPQADRNNFNGISLYCSTGVNTTSSVTTGLDLTNFNTGGYASLPLLFTCGSDYVSLALPNLPATLDLTQTFIDFTSNSSGDFTAGPTDSIAFSQSLIPLTSGDQEARFPLSLLPSTARRQVTGVRFRIRATANCTFRCLAIRCLANTWTFAPVDQNTLYRRVQLTVPPTGSLTQTRTFPVATSGSPTDWPILFRSDPQATDPTPVDLELGVCLHSGAGVGPNSLSLYFRETPTVANQQSDLDTLTMAQMEALGVQPDATPPSTAFAPDTMGDLDHFGMTLLDTDTMRILETGRRLPTTRYLVVTIQWGSTASVRITDQSGVVLYTFNAVGIAASSDYYVLTRLHGESLRVQIYTLTPEGYVNWSTPTFDSTAIVDKSLVLRRKGRFGWYARFTDGDTYLYRLRDRYVVHNEYLSLPFLSDTPVEGARLYDGATPDRELYGGAVATAGAKLVLDSTKSKSGRCLRVECDGSVGQEGLLTSAMRFTNLTESRIEFDILAPPSVQFLGSLTGELRQIPLNIPPLTANQWQHICLPLDLIGTLYQPGPYQLALVQSRAVQSTWYVDNLVIRTKAIAWAGRQAGDAWRMSNPDWTPFRETDNNPTNGILFDRGQRMQIRGRGLVQDATVSHLQVLPKYSQLGNFIWADQIAAIPIAHSIPSFTVSFNGATISVNAIGSTLSSNGVTGYQWSWGDGTYSYSTKTTNTHTYAQAGIYTVTLTIIDAMNIRDSTSQSVNVSLGMASLPLVLTR